MIGASLPQRRPSLPSLEDLLAQVQARTTTAPAVPDTLAQQWSDMRLGQTQPELGLESLTAPYDGRASLWGGMGAFQLPGFMGDPGFGAPAGMPPFGGDPGFYGGGSGSSVAGGSAAPVPYTGPPDPTVSQWEAAYPTTGRIPQEEMRRVPMNSSALVERYEDARPWEDVRTQMPNAARDFMMPEAAQAYRVMMRDAADEGVPLIFGESYRDYDEQVAAAQSRGIYGQGGWAAVPGTSNHGLGLALDLNLGASPGQREWLLENGPEYGFHFPMSDEPWHIEYMGGYDGWTQDFQPDWTGGGGGPSPSRGGAPPPPPSHTSGPRRRRSTPDPRIARLMREGY